MSEPDLGAIAHYLKLLPPTDGTPPVTMAQDGGFEALRAGDVGRPRELG